MASPSDSLIIVGLGNPGPKHAADRHNVGFWFADQLAAHIGGRFSAAQKLHGEECQGSLRGCAVRIIKPGTFMNRSGQCVRRVIDYYHVPLERLLVVHDELDLPPGVARLKQGGGHGGHNGLRDIIASIGPDFLRLRVGIGHPGHRDQVTDYVLHGPGKEEHGRILDALSAALEAVEVLAGTGLPQAMQRLHSVTPRTDATGEFGPAG